MLGMDLCITAGRRAGLLADTLHSFEQNLFRHVRVERVIANIDPVFGDESDLHAVQAVLRAFFPQAEIRVPAVPDFCESVKGNWERTQAALVFHLEDDWLLNEPIDIGAVQERFAHPLVMQVALHHKEKNWDIARRGEAHTTRRRLRIGGLSLPLKRRFPVFTTSPAFLRGEFARGSAALMDCRFDPEKQFYRGVNPPLERYVRPYRSLLYAGTQPYLITDTGRQWRDARGIAKTFVNHASVWSGHGQAQLLAPRDR